MDELRLSSGVPTLKYLIDKGAKLVLMSHHSDDKQSLAPVVPVLSKLLGRDVGFVPDCVGPQVETAVQALQPGGVLMLENLRFHKQEEANDPAFAKQLAALGDICGR